LYKDGDARWRLGGRATSILVSLRYDLPPETLAMHELEFTEEGSDRYGRIILTPVDSVDLRRIRDVQQRLAEGGRVPPGWRRGTVEWLVAHRPTELDDAKNLAAIRRIRSLASKEDDPPAWAELALAFDRADLRPALERGLREIGAEKVLALITSREGPWPDGLREFLEDEIRMAKRSGPPVDSPMFDHDAYGVADF
jgi:hypothetical protein